jgi:UDP-glucose:(glucosyl)LPS alpha-1,2-glucosyltransferase
LIGFEENEINKNAFGGTEIIARHLARVINPSLLENVQIISSRVRELEEDKIRVLFCHDLANDPEVEKFKNPEWRQKIHQFVFISNWQYQQFQYILGFPYTDNCSVIEVGFDPIEVDWTKKNKETTRFCYTSTPQRGLTILVPVFSKFAEKNPNTHLDVFSSYKMYGWEKSDEQFEPLFDQIRNNPNMTYHGFKPHDEVIEYLKTADIHAYPCIWQETSCRAMEEAMSAGLACVHPNIAALPDTSGGLNFMYQGDTSLEKHANIFFAKLQEVYDFYKDNKLSEYLKYVKSYADNRYNMTKIKFQWESLLTGLNMKYPTPASRKVESPFFVIDTNRNLYRR